MLAKRGCLVGLGRGRPRDFSFADGVGFDLGVDWADAS